MSESSSILDAKLVEHVANLAHLDLTSDDVVHYQAQLAKVLGYIAELDTLPDSLGEGWRADVLAEGTPERADVEQPSLPAEAALAAAPRRVGTAFQVPRIIE